MNTKLTSLLIILSFLVAPLSMASGTEEFNQYVLMLPESNLSVSVNLPGFEVELGEDLNSMNVVHAFNEKEFMTVSVGLVEAEEPGGVSACRDFHFRHMHEGMEKVNEYEISRLRDWKFNEMRFKDYMIFEMDGVPINQKVLTGCAEKNGYWILINVSKALYKSKDRSKLTDILRDIQIVEHNDINDEVLEGYYEDSGIENLLGEKSLEHYAAGNLYFYSHDYKSAIVEFEKALELDKKNPKLSKIILMSLVDNLGMAYGLTRDYAKAKSTFEYGIREVDSKAPMFYYNLACMYAEQGDLSKTLKYLARSFRYRKYIPYGQEFPDILKDNSFKKLLNEPRFQNAAKRFNRLKSR